MGTDVVDIALFDAGQGDCLAHRPLQPVLARHGDVVAVRREGVPPDLAEDHRAACPGQVVALQHHRCRAAARHQAVASGVEGAGSALGVVEAGREGAEAVEAAHRLPVDFLGAPADHPLLPPERDQVGGLADGVATAGAGGTDGPAGTAGLEKGVEIHRDAGGHRAKDVAATDQLGLAQGPEQVDLLDRRDAAGVAAKDQAGLRVLHQVVAKPRHRQRVAGGGVGLHGEIRHGLALLLRQERPLIEAGDRPGQGASEAEFAALLIDHDTRAPRPQRLPYRFNRIAQAGNYSYSGYSYSMHGTSHEKKGWASHGKLKAAG